MWSFFLNVGSKNLSKWIFAPLHLTERSSSLLKCCKQGIVGDQTPRDHIQKFDDESLPGMLD